MKTLKKKTVTVTETKTRELGEYDFLCEGCKTVHHMASYAVAQITMGHEIIFTCDCGHKTYL